MVRVAVAGIEWRRRVRGGAAHAFVEGVGVCGASRKTGISPYQGRLVRPFEPCEDPPRYGIVCAICERFANARSS